MSASLRGDGSAPKARIPGHCTKDRPTDRQPVLPKGVEDEGDQKGPTRPRVPDITCPQLSRSDRGFTQGISRRSQRRLTLQGRNSEQAGALLPLPSPPGPETQGLQMVAGRTPATPSRGEARVTPWIILTGGAARAETQRLPPRVGEATVLGFRGSGIPSEPGAWRWGTVCDAFPRLARARRPLRLPRVIRAAVENEVGAVAPRVDRTPGCVSSKYCLDVLGVILTCPSAPPGGPGGRIFPAAEDLGKTRPGERSAAHLVGPVWEPAPANATPSASWGPRWPYCTVVPLASPIVYRKMGRGHI